MSTSNTTGTVLANLSGHTRTLGWDAVVAYNANAVNDLFAAQFVRLMRPAAGGNGNSNFPPINGDVSITSNTTLLLNELVLGPPLISFSPNSTSSAANIAMDFVSGQLLVQSKPGGSTYISSVLNIAPGDQYELQLVANVKDFSGTVTPPPTPPPTQPPPPSQTPSLNVVLDLPHASQAKASLLPGSAAQTILGAYIQQVWNEQASQNPTYALGGINIGTGSTSSVLMPASFRIATQAAGDATGSGAVLLLVQSTWSSQGGNLPGADYVKLIPDSKRAALLIASETLFNKMIGPHYQKNVPGCTFTVQNGPGGTDPASFLALSGSVTLLAIRAAAIVGDSVYHGWTGGWHGGAQTSDNVNFPYAGITIKPSTDGRSMQFDWNGKFKQEWAASTGSVRAPNESGSSDSLNMTISANFQAMPVVNPDDVIGFSGTPEMPEVKFSSSAISWVDKWVVNMSTAIQSAFNNRLGPTMTKLVDLQLPAVNAFAVSHLLFPKPNVLSFNEAFIPGDLAVFGDVEPTSTAFTVTPLQVALGPGQSKTFATTPDETSISWNVFPTGFGSITTNGTFNAASTLGKTTTVTVTAAKGDDNASAVIVLVPQAVVVNPSFAFVPDGHTEKFSAATVDTTSDPAWSVSWLSPDETGSAGSITAGGTYSLPSTIPSGLSLVSVTATVNGNSGSAVVAISKNLPLEQIDPQYVVLNKSGTQQFTVDGATSGSSFTWSVLSGDGGSITAGGTYTAPSAILSPSVTAVLAANSADKSDCGFAVVILEPSERRADSQVRPNAEARLLEIHP